MSPLPPTPHEETIALFSAYFEAELAPPQLESLELHLARCVPCKQEYLRFEEALALLHRVPSLRAPSSFTHRVVARTHEKKRRLRRGPLQRLVVERSPVEWLIPIVLIAALVALVVVVLSS